MIYRTLLRPALFQFDSEAVHNLIISLLKLYNCAAKTFPLVTLQDKRLNVNCFGLDFPNPVGLAAGFDKHMEVYPALASLGFGFLELGTITAKAQQGNERPRIFRLIEDEALINRMGFPSKGAEYALSQIKKLGKVNIPIGVNLGKTKAVAIDDAVSDYLESFRLLKDYGDYFVLNVSSPNTPELRKLQEPARLKELFEGIQSENKLLKPVLIKLAPDLSDDELEASVSMALELGVAGLIATNTTFSRDGLTRNINETGGLSGKPLHQISLARVSRINQITESKLPLIAVGGISSANEVVNFYKAGASLVQLYTAFIYQGPYLVKKINLDLLNFMQKHGLNNLNEIKDLA